MIKKTTTLAFALLTIFGFTAGATFAQTASPTPTVSPAQSPTTSPTPTTTIPEGAPSTGMAR